MLTGEHSFPNGFTPFPEIDTQDQQIVIESLPIGRQALIDSIINRICKEHDVSRLALLGDRRDAKTVAARFEVYHALYNGLGISAARIGRIIGKRDHSTILKGLNRREELRRRNAA